MKKLVLLIILCISSFYFSFAQYNSKLSATQWVDSVFNSLTPEQRIAQLMVIRAHSNLGADHVAAVTNLIKQYNAGALCFFQGGPVRQALLTNYYQSIAQTPLMVTIDGEWGLGMRLDSVIKYPYQLTMGAMRDSNLVYQIGKAIGEQCKRMGIQVNYAPVVDINNNPNNPVIGFRSFGEDKYKVARYGVAIMKGMQDAGIMACAKHFPGHGDVSVDSHLDLPVINKSIAQLDSLELFPFKAMFNAGVGSVMIAHLSVPAIDSTEHVATSISKNNVTGLLRDSLQYKGLTFTDALEMKGVAKYFPGGTIAVQALIAGNDMLCLPEDVGKAIDAIKAAIAQKQLSWDDLNVKVKKVLLAKYQLGLNMTPVIDTTNLVNDLNAKTNLLRDKVARETITVVKPDTKSLLLPKGNKIAYVRIGTGSENSFSLRLQRDWNADTFELSYKDSTDKASNILQQLQQGHYDNVVVSVSDYNLRPANNYGISATAISLFNQLQTYHPGNFIFGNVLAASNFCGAENLVLCYQDDNITQDVAADVLEGTCLPRGTLPVGICNYSFGTGIDYSLLNKTGSYDKLEAIDSIVNDAIEKKAFPGCVVLAAHDGKIIYNKAFGNYQYNVNEPVNVESIYDLASVTKVSATTISVMKLYEQGKLDLAKTLGDYLPWVKGSNKEHLKIENILLHQAGLVPFIPFYKETIDSVTGAPKPEYYSTVSKPGFSIRVAENLYLRNDWNDTMYKRILDSPVGPADKYVYSDNDFIFLGKVVEAISGMPLNEYVQKTFYDKMGLATTGFKPRNRFSLKRIVPTEKEDHFRRQLIWGDVHDEGASMFGGVAGHAGLFSDSYDLASLYQMLLNGGELNGHRFLKASTINYFNEYHSKVSRRGFGFDKPEKDNATRPEPYPSVLASPQTFGHTGFTGTCVWVDPKYKLVYIFLSNRVSPTRDNPRLLQMNVRGKIMDVIIEAIR